MATVGELIKKSDKNVDIGIVIDESGSMQSMKEVVIKCFNDFLLEQKQQGDDAFVTLVTFSDNVKFAIERKNISSAKAIGDRDYSPYGTTALYDAIFTMIKRIEEENKNNKVIIAIITDGYENASKKCNLDMLKKLIKEKEELGWKILFLASNIDVKTTAKSFGLSVDNSAEFKYTKEGYSTMNSFVTCSVSNYRNVVRNEK